jgi:translation initiation factor 3 subunit C
LKAAAIISREKNPRFYIRSLCHLDDHIKKTLENKDLIKKMNPSTAKAFNAMKQKIRKQVKLYENDVEAFKAVNSLSYSYLFLRILWKKMNLLLKLND